MVLVYLFLPSEGDCMALLTLLELDGCDDIHGKTYLPSCTYGIQNTMLMLQVMPHVSGIAMS